MWVWVRRTRFVSLFRLLRELHAAGNRVRRPRRRYVQTRWLVLILTVRSTGWRSLHCYQETQGWTVRAEPGEETGGTHTWFKYTGEMEAIGHGRKQSGTQQTVTNTPGREGKLTRRDTRGGHEPTPWCLYVILNTLYILYIVFFNILYQDKSMTLKTMD